MNIIVLIIVLFFALKLYKSTIKSKFGDDIVIPRVINKVFIQHSGG